jgi:hypothetical protein
MANKRISAFDGLGTITSCFAEWARSEFSSLQSASDHIAEMASSGAIAPLPMSRTGSQHSSAAAISKAASQMPRPSAPSSLTPATATPPTAVITAALASSNPPPATPNVTLVPSSAIASSSAINSPVAFSTDFDDSPDSEALIPTLGSTPVIEQHCTTATPASTPPPIPAVLESSTTALASASSSIAPSEPVQSPLLHTQAPIARTDAPVAPLSPSTPTPTPPSPTDPPMQPASALVLSQPAPAVSEPPATPPVPDDDALGLIVGFLAPVSNGVLETLSHTESGLVPPTVAPAKIGRHKRKQPAVPVAEESVDPAPAAPVRGVTRARTRQLQAQQDALVAAARAEEEKQKKGVRARKRRKQ